MLCPAVLDPFEGPYYRIYAVLHQAFLCPALCKLFCLVSFVLMWLTTAALRPTNVCQRPAAGSSANGKVLDDDDVAHVHAD